MEGLQGWMAEIERKQARITYFGGLVLLLALAAAGVALYFGLTTHSDSATKNDLDSLTNRVDSLQGAVTKNSKDTQNALNASIAQLQQSISGLQKQQAQAQATISTLQSQVAAGALNKNATTPGVTPPTVTPTTPGAATTTTTPNGGKSP
jgi:septal ring factor EnvC (AmiA/AmiB activator)